jgi:hypothetical protein
LFDVLGKWHRCIEIHQLNLKPFIIIEFLVEKSFKIKIFTLFKNNKCIIMYFSRKKPLLHEKGGDFIGGIHILLLVFFYLAMFHEPQT